MQKLSMAAIAASAALALAVSGGIAAHAGTWNYGYFQCAVGYKVYTSASRLGTATHTWGTGVGSEINYTQHGSGSPKTVRAYSIYRTLYSAQVTGTQITSANEACYS